MSIEELLNEGKSLRDTIAETAQPEDTIRSFKIYHSTNEAHYDLWLIKCQEYLSRNTTPDFSRAFSAIASEGTVSVPEKLNKCAEPANLEDSVELAPR